MFQKFGNGKDDVLEINGLIIVFLSLFVAVYLKKVLNGHIKFFESLFMLDKILGSVHHSSHLIKCALSLENILSVLLSTH